MMRGDPGFTWPGGARLAVAFNVMFEGWSEGKAPGIGPMGNPLQRQGVVDTQAVAWARYAGTTGIWRLLEILGRHGVRGTVFASGVVAERYGEALRAAVTAGHEVAAHSYAQEIIPATLDEAEERDNIAKSVAAIERAAGVRPRGWVSPRGTPSPHTARLLAAQGFAWTKDCFDSDLPYLLDAGGRPLVAIPLMMEVNDMPLSVRYGNAPRVYFETFRELFDRLYEAEPPPTFLDVTVHAHVFGRPLGGRIFDEVIRFCRGVPDLWHPTNSQVADLVLQARPAVRPG